LNIPEALSDTGNFNDVTSPRARSHWMKLALSVTRIGPMAKRFSAWKREYAPRCARYAPCYIPLRCPGMSDPNIEQAIADTKRFRLNLDEQLQALKTAFTLQPENRSRRASRERSTAITKIQEAIMLLGMDLKAINGESPGSSRSPYPQSYDPASPVIEPTADGLKL